MKPAGAVASRWSAIAAPTPFEVWRVDLRRELPPDELELLDASEHERASRFAFDPLRRRYRAAHVALRRLLARDVGVAPQALRFERGAHGKPRLAGLADAPAFNLSDSEDVALIAIAPGGDIGVDVERLRPIDDAQALAALHFCARESAWLREARPSLRDRAFLRVWVAKEACLKAIGSGLSIAAAGFDGDVGDTAGPGWRRVAVPTPEGMAHLQVKELDVGDDCVAALARRVEVGAS